MAAQGDGVALGGEPEAEADGGNPPDFSYFYSQRNEWGRTPGGRTGWLQRSAPRSRLHSGCSLFPCPSE